MRLLLAVLFLSTLVAPLSANAATMRYAAPSELASLSDLVVVAQVSTSETIREDNGRLVTFTTFAVADVWLDASPGAALSASPLEVTVRQWGGEWGDDDAREVQAVAGDARLPEGAQLVLFLRAAGDGVFTLTALSQSVFVMDVVPGDLDLGVLSLRDALRIASGRDVSLGWGRSLEGVLGAGESLPHRETWPTSELQSEVERTRDGAVEMPPSPTGSGDLTRGGGVTHE